MIEEKIWERGGRQWTPDIWAWCYNILHYTTLYYIILHYTTLYCIVLHYTTLYYNIIIIIIIIIISSSSINIIIIIIVIVIIIINDIINIINIIILIIISIIISIIITMNNIINIINIIIIIIIAATVPCPGSLVLSRGSLYRILMQHSPHTCYSLSTSQATEGLIFTDKYLFPLAYGRSLSRRNWCVYIYILCIYVSSLSFKIWHHDHHCHHYHHYDRDIMIYIYTYNILSYYHHDRFYSHCIDLMMTKWVSQDSHLWSRAASINRLSSTSVAEGLMKALVRRAMGNHGIHRQFWGLLG